MAASAPRDRSRGASLLSQNTNPSTYGSITDDDHSSFHSTSTHEATQPHASTSTNTRRKRRKLPKPVLNLVNSGSVARDHLASERTFLAYVRTSLAISSMGVALVQLFRISPMSGTDRPGHYRTHLFAEVLGAILVLTGLLTLFIGLSRFFAVQNALLNGKFPASRLVVILPAIILAMVISVVFSILVAFRVESG